MLTKGPAGAGGHQKADLAAAGRLRFTACCIASLPRPAGSSASAVRMGKDQRGLIALLLFRQSSEAIVDLLTGQRPVGVPYLHNAYPLEILVQPERSVILAEVFRQNGERQLRRAAAAIPPFEAARTVIPQV